MPRTMLTDQHWLKLKSAVHNFVFISHILLEVFLKQFFIELKLADPYADRKAHYGYVQLNYKVRAKSHNQCIEWLL